MYFEHQYFYFSIIQAFSVQYSTNLNLDYIGIYPISFSFILEYVFIDIHVYACIVNDKLRNIS